MADNELEKDIKKAVRQALQERGVANILVAGKTGVGKSTLINSVFEGNLAATGVGRPVTMNTREIRKEGIPVALFDTRGLEVKEFAETLAELKHFVNHRRKQQDAEKHIHAAWVCIAEDIRRVEDAEQQLVHMLEDCGVPTIGVITKSRSDGGFRSEVQKILPSLANVVRVRSIPEELDDGHTLPAMGLDELVHLTMEVVPDGQRNAFVAAQKVDLNLKAQRAHALVAAAALAAGGSAATPIPMVELAAILPIEISMLAGISSVFGLRVDRAFLGTVVSGAVAAAGGSFTRRAIVAGLLKLFPGLGSVAGGFISGAAALTFTSLFGEAYIQTLLLLLKNSEPGDLSPALVKKAFERKLKEMHAKSR